MFELEHFHNFILLLLVLEIDIQLEKLLQVWDKKDVDVTMTISDLKAMSFRVLQNRGCTIFVVGKLLSYLKRVYTAFDTEYNVVDSKETDLLCLTTSTHTGVLLRPVVSENLNQTSQLRITMVWIIIHCVLITCKPVNLLTLIRIIRLVNDKKDDNWSS